MVIIFWLKRGLYEHELLILFLISKPSIFNNPKELSSLNLHLAYMAFDKR